MNASFTGCSWAALAHAGWQPRVVALAPSQGRRVVKILFTGPQGQVEERAVPTDRLGRALRAQLDRVAPQRRSVKMKVRIS